MEQIFAEKSLHSNIRKVGKSESRKVNHFSQANMSHQGPAPASSAARHFAPATSAHPSSTHSQRPDVVHSPASIPPKLVTPDTLARGPIDQFISSGSFSDGTLTVDVASPAWAQEVLMRKPQILEALNRKAGLIIVKNLRTRIRHT